ncbi:MAG: HAD-IA family hydrolase [Eubacteriales bacterium]|jgi:beta-phosphoglucomutase|nr:HAD-IA family hydrolase [Eubacteriales bacterium]
MKKVELVIFDMDGVLVDSEPAINLASREALSEWGIKATAEDFHQFTGMGDDKFIGGVAEKYGAAYSTAMKKRAYEIYLETAKERVKVYSRSKDIIDRLYTDGFKLAIASASDIIKVECNLACIGADTKKLSAIITGSDVLNKKPAPDIFLLAAEKSGMPADRSMVIEDAVSGVQAAKSAGMICIAITTSFNAEQLRAAGADYIIDDLSGIPDIINMINTVD